jgi:hypothetical protein
MGVQMILQMHSVLLLHVLNLLENGWAIDCTIVMCILVPIAIFCHLQNLRVWIRSRCVLEINNLAATALFRPVAALICSCCCVMVLEINNLAVTALFRPVAAPEQIVLLHHCVAVLHLLCF